MSTEKRDYPRGDFSFFDPVCRMSNANCTPMFALFEKENCWHLLDGYKGTWELSPELHKALAPVSEPHSGFSMAWTLRQMEYIHNHSWGEYVRMVLDMNETTLAANALTGYNSERCKCRTNGEMECDWHRAHPCKHILRIVKDPSRDFGWARMKEGDKLYVCKRPGCRHHQFLADRNLRRTIKSKQTR